jgi:lipase
LYRSARPGGRSTLAPRPAQQEPVADHDRSIERTEPFAELYEVPVPGGGLNVARSGPPPEESDGVVLAAHGVTASLMTFRSIARELSPRITLLVPDLRGRGLSAKLPGPYGIATHVNDLLAVLDHAGASSAVLAGHSMGAYIVARIAAEHPSRASGVVLLDAGLPFPLPDDPGRMLDGAVTNAVMRLAITFPSADEYVEGWRAHPAFSESWDDDIEAYARYDLTEDNGVARCGASGDAVRTDSREMLLDAATRNALERVRAPIHLLRAARGLFDDDDSPLIPENELHKFALTHPEVRVEEVPDVNHYTLVMGSGPGPQRVIAALERAVFAG